MTPDSAAPSPLVCAECGREQVGDERGWRSYLTVDEEEPVEAIILLGAGDA